MLVEVKGDQTHLKFKIQTDERVASNFISI